MEQLRYSLPLLELKAAERSGVIEGLASTWDDLDLHGDILQKGAFQESLDEHAAAGTQPAMLFGHSQNEPIGRWLEIREDNQGLRVKGQLTLTVRKAQEAYDLARDGALALSIGFRPIRQKAHKGANLIEKVFLGEVSLVGLAANPRARITSVKSLSQVTSITEYQSFLHDLGLSVREAKRLARSGWGAYCGTELDEAEVADFIRASAFRIKGI
jgi:HK97 family phage prohead protease